MKLTKAEFEEILKESAADLISESIDQGKATLALEITLIGALYGATIIKKLFSEENSEIEIVKE